MTTEQDQTVSAMTSFLSPWILSTHSNHGIFGFKDCVHSALITGLGLPYDAPCRQTSLATIRDYDWDLEHARDGQPTGSRVARTDHVTLLTLEWFLVFRYLYVRDGIYQFPYSCEYRESPYPGHHVNIVNRQLGFNSDEDLIKSPFDSGLPMLNLGYGPMLWESSTVPQTCAHVDNYLALWRGEILSWYTRNHHAHNGNAPLAANSREDQANLAEKSCRAKRLMDIDATLGRRGDARKHRHHERFTESITFLGVVMEELRSLLADWKHRCSDPGEDASEIVNPWTIEIPPGGIVQFRASS